MDLIKPIIKKNLDTLFVGINPVEGSITKDGYDYFSNNSAFYTILYKAGITNSKISSKEMLDNNLGIVNFYYDIFGDYNGIPNVVVAKYRDSCINLIGRYAPDKVAIMSKHVAEKILLKVVEFGHIRSIFYCVPFPTYPMTSIKKLQYYKELLL